MIFNYIAESESAVDLAILDRMQHAFLAGLAFTPTLPLSLHDVV